MERVAVNQDKTQKQRADYIYQQRIRVATRRTSGKLLRQETTLYSVAPTSSGTEKQIKSLDGRYWRKGEYIDYHGEPRPEPEDFAVLATASPEEAVRSEALGAGSP